MWRQRFLAWCWSLVLLLYRSVPSSSLCCSYPSLRCILLPPQLYLFVCIPASNARHDPDKKKMFFFWSSFHLSPSSSTHSVLAQHEGLHAGERGGSPPGQRFVLARRRVNMTCSNHTNLVYTATAILQS